MNRQILRLSGVAMVLLAALDRRDDLLADLGSRRPRREAGQRDPAGCAVLDPPRCDLRRAGGCSRGNRAPLRRRESAVLPPLPARTADGARRRLLDGGRVRAPGSRSR